MKRLLIAAALSLAATIASATPSATNVWETTLSLGLSSSDGNTKSQLFNGSWLSEYMDEAGDDVRIGLDALNGETDSKKSADSVKGFVDYKYSLSDRWYGLVDISALYDSVADISYRVIGTPGVGYYLLKDSKATLSLDLGPSYVMEKVGGEKNDYAAARASERYERKLSATAKCWQSLEYIPQIDDFDNYLVNGEIGVEAALTTKFNVRLVFKDQYDNVPAEGRVRNDTQVIAALAVKI